MYGVYGEHMEQRHTLWHQFCPFSFTWVPGMAWKSGCRACSASALMSHQTTWLILNYLPHEGTFHRLALKTCLYHRPHLKLLPCFDLPHWALVITWIDTAYQGFYFLSPLVEDKHQEVLDFLNVSWPIHKSLSNGNNCFLLLAQG